MKHIFLINPAAGRENAYEKIRSELEKLRTRIDFVLYQTASSGDATGYVKNYCRKHPTEQVRFYACGGDGTLNEVVNGIVGFDNASVTCYACGSGNDFVKYYSGEKVFLNLEELVNGKEEFIDVMRVGEKYAVNATHFGFDSCVAKTMENVRRKKIIGGKRAYTTGVVVGLFKAMKNKCRVTVDGKLLNPAGTLLLCTLANGQYVGGSYRCAPRSLDNDGLLEVCLFRPTSQLTFLRLVKQYQNGTHLESPGCQKIMEYCRGKVIHVEAPEGFVYSCDGELVQGNDFTVEVVPHAIRFAVPASAAPLPGDLHIPAIPAETV